MAAKQAFVGDKDWTAEREWEKATKTYAQHRKRRVSVSTHEERKQRLEHGYHYANEYYDTVTEFLEYGWCQHFSYAPFAPGDSLDYALTSRKLLLVQGVLS